MILFADEKFNISGLKKHISNTEYSYISDILKKRDTKKKIVTLTAVNPPARFGALEIKDGIITKFKEKLQYQIDLILNRNFSLFINNLNI